MFRWHHYFNSFFVVITRLTCYFLFEFKQITNMISHNYLTMVYLYSIVINVEMFSIIIVNCTSALLHKWSISYRLIEVEDVELSVEKKVDLLIYFLLTLSCTFSWFFTTFLSLRIFCKLFWYFAHFYFMHGSVP